MARGNERVIFCDIVEEHVSQIREQGIAIEGPQETFTVLAEAYTPAELLARGKQLETVLLCVKAQHTAEAVRQVLPLITEQTVIVSCQNGLCETIIAEMVGNERTIGCFVNFSADYLEPGRILYGGLSAVYLGELDGSVTARVLDLQRRLSCWGPVHVTDNIWGFLWGKLAYANLLFATALVDETMATVVRNPDYRETLLALTTEVLEVAAKLGVRPMGFDDWEPSLIYPQRQPELDGQLEKLAQRMAGNKKTKSGIWRDLAVRKRKTEVDFQLVPVIEIGKQFGLDLPLTSLVVRQIKEIEAGERAMSWDNLACLQAAYAHNSRVGGT